MPSHANTEVLAWAHSFGARVLLNLAPARDTDPAAMSHIDILVVNETEAGLTLGLPAPATPTEAIGVARALRGMGRVTSSSRWGAQGGGVGVGCRGGSLSRCQPRRGRGHHGRGRRVRGCAGGGLALGKPFVDAVADGMRAGATAILSPGAASSYGALPTVTRD